MAKKKKKNSRILNTARKTVASLCMVTALIVAAVPGDMISAMNVKEPDTSAIDSLGSNNRAVYGTGLVNPEAYKLKDNTANDTYTFEGLVFTTNASGLLTGIKGIQKNVHIDHEDNDPAFTHDETHWDDSISANVTETVFDEGTQTTTYTTIDILDDKVKRIDLTGSGIEAVNTTSFAGMKNIENIIFPSTLGTIEKNTFKGLEELASVSGLTGCTEIGDSAFENCENLKSIQGTDALKSIGKNAFKNDGGLSSFTPSASLQEIGEYAFEGCKSLTAFSFPTTMKSNGLGTGAFKMSGLRSVDIPDGSKLDTISTDCFRECDYLTQANLGTSITTINENAFENCDALASVTMPDSVATIGGYAFANCVSLGKFTFPASGASLGVGILQGCTGLSEVNFSSPALGKVKYTNIPEYTFYGCSSLEKLDLPDGISSMAATSIRDCSSLTDMKFPATFKSIPALLFDGCNSLAHVYVYNQDSDFPNTRDPFPSGTDVTIHGYNGSTAQDYAVNNGYTFISLDDQSVQADSYTIDANGVITGADTARLLSYSTVINIPEEVNGIKVTGIGEGVFEDNNRLTEVVLPEGVKSIDNRAFAGCGKLKTVRFNSDETTFKDNSFSDTNPALIMHGVISNESEPFLRAMERGIVFTDDTYGITVAHDEESEENVLIAYDENKDTLIVPTGVDSFGEKGDGTAYGTSIFDGNQNLKTVQIYGALRLNDHQFKNCSNLESVYLPATIEKMGIAPFYGCQSLEDVTIDGGNEKFICDNGVIYELDNNVMTTLVEAIPGSRANDRFYIPSTVTKLYEEAFASPQNIGTVYFSNGVADIPTGCFEDSEITEVYLTNDVHSVGKNAFSDSDGSKPYLTRLHVPNGSTVISDTATDGVVGLTLYGPENSTAQYYADSNADRQYVFEKEDESWENSSSSKGDSSGSGASNSSSGSINNGSSSNGSGGSGGSGSGNGSSKKSSKKSNSKKKKSSSKKSSSSKGGTTTVYVTSSSSAAQTTETQPVAAPVANSGAAVIPTAGNTPVDSTDSGITEHQELISGNIDGGADNYVVKISQNPETTKEFEDALIDKYGSLDDIRYYAMDISLYDSEGKEKIEDPKGVDVTITIPIPDELALYGGNNRAAAVKDGELEELGTRFSSIDGTPCVTFTAEHFSPYGLYVDVSNLSANDVLDANPKTGDPVSPKWFLVAGLAALSVLLFMKKEKRLTAA